MKIVVMSPLILAVTMGLSGCGGLQMKSAKVSASCTGKSTGTECTMGAEAVWEKPSGGGNKFMAMMANALNVGALDAASFNVDTTGSTISYPNSGTMVVSLTRSADGAVVASQTFSWIKQGAILVASDPDAINNWAYASAGDADSVSYSLNKFVAGATPGVNTIAATGVYEGVQQASAVSNFIVGNGCTPGHTNQPCSQ